MENPQRVGPELAHLLSQSSVGHGNNGDGERGGDSSGGKCRGQDPNQLWESTIASLGPKEFLILPDGKIAATKNPQEVGTGG